MQTACSGSQVKALAHNRVCETTSIETIQIVKSLKETGFPPLDRFVLFYYFESVLDTASDDR